MPSTVADSEPFPEQIDGDALHVVRRDALDALQRLVEPELAIEVDLLPGQMRHAARRVLEAQHEAALQVILRALQLGVGNRRLLDAAQLLDDQIDHLADRFVRAARVDRERAGVAIGAQAAEDGVGEAALLAHVLETAASSSSRRAACSARSSNSDRRDSADSCSRRGTDVALLELLVADENLRRDGRRVLAHGSPTVGTAANFLSSSSRTWSCSRLPTAEIIRFGAV